MKSMKGKHIYGMTSRKYIPRIVCLNYNLTIINTLLYLLTNFLYLPSLNKRTPKGPLLNLRKRRSQMSPLSGFWEAACGATHCIWTRLLGTLKNVLNCRVSLGERSSAKSWMLIGERAISKICSSPWMLPTSRMVPLGWQLINEGKSSAWAKRVTLRWVS